jgi:hypothetical protein
MARSTHLPMRAEATARVALYHGAGSAAPTREVREVAPLVSINGGSRTGLLTRRVGMTHITRIIPAALAALAIGAPVATAMPTDASVRPQSGTAVPAQTGATDTPSACAPGTRAVHGPSGTGCTTSPRNNSELGVFALILTGAGSFAIALSATAAAGRRRDRSSTSAALSGRTY